MSIAEGREEDSRIVPEERTGKTPGGIDAKPEPSDAEEAFQESSARKPTAPRGFLQSRRNAVLVSGLVVAVVAVVLAVFSFGTSGTTNAMLDTVSSSSTQSPSQGAAAPSSTSSAREETAAEAASDSLTPAAGESPTSAEQQEQVEESETVVMEEAAPEAAAVPAETQPQAQPQFRPQPAQPSTIDVTVSVDTSRAASLGYGASMGTVSVALEEGASVYDALVATGLAVGGSSSYVSSIGGLAEFKGGSGSGWLYYVNGSSPGISCNACTLSDGDSVRWIYTMNMGKDI